ncbi:MAG: hypothetical protein MR361_10090 [Clostridiales bacterium]|nr:hypothetical protein [Clostridiales bacterium]
MDKYEYNVKSDQIKKLYSRKEFEAAAKIADEIDWYRVKDNTMINRVADIYENTKQYEKAKEVLLIAYERSPLGRQLAYKLTILALRTKNFVEADEFYQDFVEMSPSDVSQYLLKYRIAKAKGEDIEVLIKILEAYIEVEMDERWQYELAKLYHEAGEDDKCIAMCDELELWFNDGKYVDKAKELKKLITGVLTEYNKRYAKDNVAKSNTASSNTVSKEVSKNITGVSNGESDNLEANTSNVNAGSVNATSMSNSIDDLTEMASANKQISDNEDNEEYSGADNAEYSDADYDEEYDEDSEDYSQADNWNQVDALGRERVSKVSEETDEDEEAESEDHTGIRSLAEAIVAGKEERKASKYNKKKDDEDLSEDNLELLDDNISDDDDEYLDDEISAEDEARANANAAAKEVARRAEEAEKNTPKLTAEEIAANEALKAAEAAALEAQRAADLARQLVMEAKLRAEQIKSTSGTPSDKYKGMSADEISKSLESEDMLSGNSDLRKKDSMIEIFEFDKNKEGKVSNIGEELTKTAEIDIDEINIRLADENNLYNTANIQAALAKSMEKLMNDEKKVRNAFEMQIDDDNNEIRPTIEEDDSYLDDDEDVYDDSVDETEDVKESENKPEAEELETLPEVEEVETSANVNATENEPEVNEESKDISEEEAVEESKDIPEVETVEESKEDNKASEVSAPIEEVRTLEETKEEKTVEAVSDEIEDDLIDGPTKRIDRAEINRILNASKNIYQSLPKSVFENTEEEVKAKTEMTKSEEDDQIEGQMTLDEVMAEFKNNEAAESEDSEVSDSDISDKTLSGESDIKTNNDEARDVLKALEQVEETTDEVSDDILENANEASEEVAENANEASEEVAENANEVSEEAAENVNEVSEEVTEEVTEDVNETLETESESNSKKSVEESESDSKKSVEKPEDKTDKSSVASTGFVVKNHRIPEEYRSLFNDFVGTGSMEEKIADTLDNLINKFVMDGTSKTNNVIITGSAKIGKTTLGLSLIKAANRGRNRSGRKVAKVKASVLNKRGVALAMTQILGTDLIIEQAGNLMPNTIIDLMIAMKNYTEEMLIVLEDDKAAIDRMLDNSPDLKGFFSNRLDIHEMEIDDMVKIAKDYAEEQFYAIDEMGELALYAKLDDISGRNPVLSIEDIQEVIDDAIAHANRFSLGKIFGRIHKNKDDMRVLSEQDFL